MLSSLSDYPNITYSDLHSINVSVLHHFWLLWLHLISCDKSFSIDGIITVFKVYWTSSSTRPPEVRHTSFLSSQVFDLLSWFYVYLLDLVCSATLSTIQPHQISFRNLRFCHTTSSAHSITTNGLWFTTLGGKYPWLGFHQLDVCHARHT